MTRILLTALLSVSLLSALPAPAMAKDKRSPLVEVAKAETGDVIRQVPLSGTVASIRKAQLSAEVQGRVEALKVEVGDAVQAGDALLVLDSEVARYTLQGLVAATAQARAELADAKRRYADAKRLRKQASISENELQLAKTEVDVDAALLQQKQAEEMLQRARVERHTLKAPFSGVITERMAESGEWIQPGEAVLTLVEVDNVRLEFRVPQDYFSMMNDGSSLQVSLDALPGQSFVAGIDAVVPYSDSDSRTFMIHASMDSAKAQITPGMSVHGKLDLSTGAEGVVLSRDAIVRYPDGRVTVWVVKPGSEPTSVTEKRVTVGKGFNGMLPIRSGIKAGETVVIKGNESLKEGQEVRVFKGKDKGKGK